MIIAFDLGQVIFHVELELFLKDLVSDGLFTSYENADNFMEGIWVDQDLGKINISDAFKNGLFNDGFNPALPGIIRKWKGVIKPCLPMMELIFSLLAAGHKVALLSNIGTDHAALIRKDYAFIKDCWVHFSCEVGYRKPDPLFYSSFIEKNKIEEPEEVLFFDDRPENIAACPFSGVLFNLKDYYTENDARSFVEMHIKRKQSQKTLADRKPLPPEDLVEAKQDRIHETSGKLIKTTPIKKK